ncbi:PorV/PorQ family protein [candidate division KSB1 bacterium]|nr:PorV/PorQ family protein [candidate division KSB1 bacterium]
MKKIFLGFTLLAISVNLGISQGTVGYGFLRSDVSARGAALAGAQLAIPGDIYSIHYNPAGLAEIEGRVVSATLGNLLLDFTSGFVAYGENRPGWGTIGIAVQYQDYGDFEGFDEDGNPSPDFGAQDMALSFAYGTKAGEDILLGFTVKWVQSKIESYTSTAYAFDLGGIYHTAMEGLDVGVGVFNLGRVKKAFVDTKEDLPLTYGVGFAKRLAHLPMLLNGEVNQHSDAGLRCNFGGEFTLTDNLRLRLGYGLSRAQDLDVGTRTSRFGGLTVGTGFLFRSFILDYAFQSFGELGGQHLISFSTQF